MKDALLRRLDLRYALVDQLGVIAERTKDLDTAMEGQVASSEGNHRAISELAQALDVLLASSDGNHSAIEELKASVGALRGEIGQIAKALRDQETRGRRESERRYSNLYRQVEALLSIAIALQPDSSLPPLGGWALSPDVSWFLVNHVLEERPQRVVELGSGSSTVLLAMSFEKNGSGHVTSFEHDEGFLMKTRLELDSRGLGHRVDLIHAPLRDIHIGGEKYEWYGIPEDWRADVPLDLVLVDGPPSTDALNRFPALPILGPRLRPGGILVMDDSGRSDEETIVARWQNEFPDYRLESPGDHEKGTAVLVKASSSDALVEEE